jgi:hypothetical protein
MRCPVCRAENGEETSCRRCRADVSLMVRLEAGRRRELAAAKTALVAQNARDALDHAGAAHKLRHGNDSARLLALAHLVARDFAAAAQWHTRARKNPDATRSTD